MKVIIVKNYHELSKAAADIIIEAVKLNPKLNLGLATGGTTLGLYGYLVKDHKINNTSYKDIKAFNLDEYVGLPKNHEYTYYRFMHDNFFNHVNFKEDNVYIPDGHSLNLKEKALEFEQLIIDNPIDLQLLGLGVNGHIGFNEPGTSFESKTDIVSLTKETIKVNSRFFPGHEELVPNKAVSMGISSILRAKKILLLASGEKKAQAIRDFIEGPITTDLPVSCLKTHPDVTVILDEEAAQLLSK